MKPREEQMNNPKHPGKTSKIPKRRQNND